MNMAPMTHEDAMELAGLYALDALTPDEKAEVDAHLAACTLDHTELSELGGVAQELAVLAEPAGAPAALKRRVLEAYADEHGRPARSMGLPLGEDASIRSDAAARPRGRNLERLGWIAAGVAAVLVAVLGVYGLNLRQQADAANARADDMARAVAALTAPGSNVALLQGTGGAAGVSGFAAFPASGGGYMLLTGVPAAPAGKTYQAWFIAGGAPVSAGTMDAGADGNVIAADLKPVNGTQTIAITVEPAGGSEQPTSAPIIVGNVTTAT
jgi:anti-sigma-K factor RskA